jgi:hypothetical protein
MNGSKIVPFSNLRDADLMIDAVYEGGIQKNAGDDPICKLVGCEKEETMKESKKVDYQSPEWVDRFDHDILEIQSAVQLASDMLFFGSHDVRPKSVGLVLDSVCKKLDSLKELVEGVWQSIRSDKMNSPEEKEKKVLEAQEVK